LYKNIWVYFSLQTINSGYKLRKYNLRKPILIKLNGYYTFHYVMKRILLFKVPVNLDQDVTKVECKKNCNTINLEQFTFGVNAQSGSKHQAHLTVSAQCYHNRDHIFPRLLFVTERGYENGNEKV
jgi:hypothetical protein